MTHNREISYRGIKQARLSRYYASIVPHYRLHLSIIARELVSTFRHLRSKIKWFFSKRRYRFSKKTGFLGRFVVSDGSLIHYWDPKSEEICRERRHTGSLKKVRPHLKLTLGKVVRSVF